MVETYHSDIIEFFIWDLEETSERRTNGTLKICTTETSWWRTTETSLGVSFGTCLKRRRDALIGHLCYVLLRRCHDVPIRYCGDAPLFHLRRTCDVAGTYRETLLRRRYDVLLPGGILLTFFCYLLTILLQGCLKTLFALLKVLAEFMRLFPLKNNWQTTLSYIQQ